MRDGQFAMASQWMENGNASQFIEAHMDVNRFELVGFRCLLLASLIFNVVQFLQLKDVAQGLTYMHEEGMVHGDLKGVMSPTLISLLYSLTSFYIGQHPD